MSEEHPSDVLGALPRTRPHRRSDKRGARQSEPNNGTEQPATVEAKPADHAATADTKPAPKPSTTAARPARAGPKPKPKQREVGGPHPAGPRAGQTKPRPSRIHQPAQPAGTPGQPARRRPVPSRGTDLLGTAVQAAAELAEIGLSVSARAVRSAVSKLPRP